MPDTTPPPRTALDIILTWSRDRPAWQRDALRRIVQAQKLTETDIAELAALCKRGRTNQPSESDAKPQPLEARHLPANPGAGASVSLTAITDVSAVNNLASGQNAAGSWLGMTSRAGATAPCPNPEILNDVQALAVWVRDLNDRQKGL